MLAFRRSLLDLVFRRTLRLHLLATSLLAALWRATRFVRIIRNRHQIPDPYTHMTALVLSVAAWHRTKLKPPPALPAVEASIDTFRDDKEIMALIVFADKVRCHKRVLWKT